MNKLIMEPLFYIYFLYGISFMIMSILLVEGITKGSSLTLVSSFYMLVFFGVTQGTAELTDWLRFTSSKLGYSESAILVYFSQIFMIISFVFLLQFAVNLISYKSEKKGLIRTIPVILLIAYLVAVFSMGISDIRQIGLFARYGFGFTGAALSAIMLYRQGIVMKLLGNKKLVVGFFVSAAGFGLYGVCGGLIVTPLLGYPIQLYGTLCAVMIAIASTVIIDVFKVE
jgi:hypothetical protein